MEHIVGFFGKILRILVFFLAVQGLPVCNTEDWCLRSSCMAVLELQACFKELLL